MAERILVRGELSNWVHAGRGCSALAGVMGGVVGLTGEHWGWAIAISCGVLWLALEIFAWRARRSRTWLTLHPDGMEIEGPGGHRAIHDSQVSAVALETKKNFSNGELSSVTRKFTIWAEDWPESVLMENFIKVGKTDPLAGLIQRLLGRLQTRMEEDLARGGTASGDGWHLSRAALTVGRSPEEAQLPLSEVAAIEAHDGQMCVWRRGSDLAVAKLPLSGRNVYLLPALVAPFQTKTAGGGQAASANGLGRMLFERRTGRGTIMVLAIAGIGLAAVGVALLAAHVTKPVDEGAVLASVLMVGSGIFLTGLGWWLGTTIFRCHENGVWRGTPLGQRELLYANVARFQHSAVRHYHNGAYIGTQVTMRFVPAPELNAKPMKYTARTQGEDDELDRLRDAVSQLIAVKMAKQFQAGQMVPWTSNLEFTAEGIRYRTQKWFVRQPPQMLGYENYGGYELNGGVLRLLTRNDKKAVVSEQAAAENFYPGFFLLQMLLHGEDGETEGRREGATES